MKNKKKPIGLLSAFALSASLTSCLNPFYTYPNLRPDQYRNDIMFVNTIGYDCKATMWINDSMYYFDVSPTSYAMVTFEYTLASEDTEGIFPKNIDHWYAEWTLQKDEETHVEQLVVKILDDFIKYYVGGRLVLDRVSE